MKLVLVGWVIFGCIEMEVLKCGEKNVFIDYGDVWIGIVVIWCLFEGVEWWKVVDILSRKMVI